MFDNLSNSLFNKKIKTKELPFVEKFSFERRSQQAHNILSKNPCLLYTSDAADE